MELFIKRLSSVISRYSFGGAFGLLSPTFTYERDLDNVVLVRMCLLVPDRDTGEKKQIYAHRRFMLDLESNDDEFELAVRIDFEKWIVQFWEHELYESIRFDNVLIRDQHKT